MLSQMTYLERSGRPILVQRSVDREGSQNQDSVDPFCPFLLIIAVKLGTTGDHSHENQHFFIVGQSLRGHTRNHARVNS